MIDLRDVARTIDATAGSTLALAAEQGRLRETRSLAPALRGVSDFVAEQVRSAGSVHEARLRLLSLRAATNYGLALLGEGD